MTHRFDADKAEKLEESWRYQVLSRDELLSFLDPVAGMVVADLGSGTGFYTDDMAPYVDHVYAVDVQDEMHEFYADKGAPQNVTMTHADVRELPFNDNYLDAATMLFVFHECNDEETFHEIARVMKHDGTLIIVDWSRHGEGELGPGLDERFDAAEAAQVTEETGFHVEKIEERPETFILIATKTSPK